MSEKQTEGAAWRKMLAPLVTGLVALVAALTATYQSPKAAEVDARLNGIESHLEVLDYRTASVDELRSDLKDLSASVNKILGLLELERSKRK